MSADTALTGLETPDLKVIYSQNLKRCRPGNNDPGRYLVFDLLTEPVNTQFTVTHDDKPVCDQAITVAPPLQMPAPTHDFQSAMPETAAQYIEVNGVRTRYFDKGKGPVLILVHGGQPSAADFNAWEWQQNFAALAENFRVIALDRIGQGYTDNPADLDAYASYYLLVVEHLHGFIQALDLERVHLVGHSQGGWPVTRLAVDNPGLVASVVVVDSTMVAPAADASGAVRFYIWHQTGLHPDSGETAESIRRGMESFSFTNNNITDQRIERILTISKSEKYQLASQWFNASRMSPAHPTFRELKTEIWKDLSNGRLQVPMLIIWGREDPEGSFDAGQRMVEALGEAGTEVEFIAFEQSGHVPYMEYPVEFNAAVTNFVRAHP
jgi:2-hydroxy-6-oxo-6-(2'-carboxyphenyl)-hexa-2,4-dienoate hydrolase